MATPQSLQANFQMTAGDTIGIDVQVADLNGDPISLDGATGTWAMARSVEGPVIVSKTIGGGGIVILDPPDAGVLEILLAVGDTLNLLPGVYYHELQVVDAGGDTSTVIRGNITLSAALIPSDGVIGDSLGALLGTEFIAAAGADQATAARIRAMVSIVNSGTGCIVMPPLANLIYGTLRQTNITAADVTLYPWPGDSFMGLAVNQSVILPAGGSYSEILVQGGTSWVLASS